MEQKNQKNRPKYARTRDYGELQNQFDGWNLYVQKKARRNRQAPAAAAVPPPVPAAAPAAAAADDDDGYDTEIYSDDNLPPNSDDDGYATEIYSDDNLPPNFDDAPKPKKSRKKNIVLALVLVPDTT